MKEKIQLLNKLIALGVINPAHYYNISIGHYTISLQGNYDCDRVADLMSRIKFETKISPSGFVELNKGKIRVVLT